ncbi:MAG: CbtB domain-containing protein [Rhizobiaceae bacterium]
MLTTTNTQGLTLTVSQRITTALFAGTLGIFLLYGAAFANSDMLHNATHDTRHAIVAPCH